MGKKLILLALALMVSFETASAASADDFYKGKTIRIVVGFSAGGGFDTYARAIVVLQANRRTHPDLPQVPQAIKLAKTDEGRKMIDVGIHSDSDIVRTYTLPPGTPKDRVQLLRKAFEDTLKDPEFLADANKSKLNVDPVPADAIEKDISALFKLDPSMVGKLKDILYN